MDRVASAVNNFPGAEVAWVQEEPKNQGAYSYIVPRFQTSMKYFYRGTEGGTEGDLPLLKYIGRPVSATTAGGSFRLHGNEQRDLIERALTV
jgi:2-oxoglutarate dehydrogenase complex dehydrogenase (E1) component-like enzyme